MDAVAVVAKRPDADPSRAATFRCKAAPHVAWIGLGSNLQAPQHQIASALDELSARAGIRLLGVSALYRTTPVGGPAGQPDFCNACAACATSHTPWSLLALMQSIEQAHGRVRDVRWGPRTLDLDLLAFDELTLDDARLTLPHPRAHERAFVLVPLAEIAPALTLHGHGRVADLADAVDRRGVSVWSNA